MKKHIYSQEQSASPQWQPLEEQQQQVVVVERYVEHFDRNFDLIKDEQYEQVQKEWPMFLRTENTQRAFIKRGYIGGMGMPIKNRDLQRIPFDEPVPGPIAFFQPQNYRLGYQIERQMVEDEQWGLLASRPINMLRGSSILMDMTGADLLNNGFTTQSYDFGGTPLFSTAHVREDKGGTWGNQIAIDLPITVETVFNAIVELLYNMTDSRGFPVAYSGAITIYVSSANATLWRQAIEVVKSVMNPNTADNRINAVMQQFQLSVTTLRFLTNPNKWFLGWAPTSPMYGLMMVIRQNPDVSPLAPFSDNPDAWFARLRQRFVVGYENKRGIAAIGA